MTEAGQSLARVPWGNTNPLKVPDGLEDEEVLFLSDIFPTGFFGTDIASIDPDVKGIQPGDNVAVFGAGPVGYFAVLSALKLRGAAQVFSVDHIQNRLEKCKALGATTINSDEEDPVQKIKEATQGNGAICIDAVGFEAVGHQDRKANESTWDPQNPLQIFEWMTQVARKNSVAGIPGVYSSAYDKFPLGKLFQREIQIRMGQCPVKKYDEG